MPYPGRKIIYDFISPNDWRAIETGTYAGNLLSNFQTALATNPNSTLYVPPGTFPINGTLDMGSAGAPSVLNANRMIGDNRIGCRIVQQASNVPIVQLGGYGCTLSGLLLSYANSQAGNTASSGVEFCLAALSEMWDLQVDGAYNALAIPQRDIVPGGGNNITNFFMRDIWVTNFLNDGIQLLAYQGGGDCTIANVFMDGGGRSVNCCYNFTGMEIKTIECNALGCIPLQVMQASNCYGDHDFFHMEVLQPRGSAGTTSMVLIDDGAAIFSCPTIGGIQFLQSNISSGPAVMSVFMVDGAANLTVRSPRSVGNTASPPPMKIYQVLPAAGFSGGAIDFHGVIQGATDVGYAATGYGTALQYSLYG